jgi:acyl dehydratase
MTAPSAIALDSYRSKVGHVIGTSSWLVVDQERIEAFAKTTGDEQFIHVDPERARTTPVGGTIAHGFLTLSLLSAMFCDAVPPIEDAAMGVNYGLNTVRFLTPVRSRVRGRFTLKDCAERKPGQWQSTFGVEVEIDGEGKPAPVGEWVNLAAL